MKTEKKSPQSALFFFLDIRPLHRKQHFFKGWPDRPSPSQVTPQVTGNSPGDPTPSQVPPQVILPLTPLWWAGDKPVPVPGGTTHHYPGRGRCGAYGRGGECLKPPVSEEFNSPPPLAPIKILWCGRAVNGIHGV